MSPVNHQKVPPWKIKGLEYCKDLSCIKKSNITDVHFRSLFFEHFDEYKDCFSIYTDGSKTKEGVGYAIVYDNTFESRRISNETSIFTAELLGILHALKKVYQILNLS